MKIIKNYKNVNKVKIRDLCYLNLGQSPNSESYTNEKDGVPFFQGAADFSEKYTKIRVYTNNPIKMAKKNDLLMTVRAPVGRVNLASHDCSIGRGLCNFVLHNDKIKEYLYFYLNYLYKNNAWDIDSQGAIFDAVNKTAIENKEIIIDFDTYEKISDLLSSFERRIDLIKTLLEKIEIRNQYYAENFLNGNLILKNDNIKSDNIIFKKNKILDICSITTGKKDANEGSPDGEYTFFTCSLDNKKINTYSYDEEAILITGNGDPGVCKYINGKFDAYQRVYILKNIQYDAKYLYYFMKTFFKDSIQNSKVGGVIQYIKLNDISAFNFVYPDDDNYAKEILLFLDKLYSEKEKIQKLLSLEEQRFEWLSDKLLSGEYIIED